VAFRWRNFVAQLRNRLRLTAPTFAVRRRALRMGYPVRESSVFLRILFAAGSGEVTIVELVRAHPRAIAALLR